MNFSSTVPNVFPTVTGMPYKIAIIGEAPGEKEELLGVPFVGPSGGLLDALLTRANIMRSACFLGNVCQYRPPANDITAFEWDSEEIQTSIQQLEKDITQYDPNLIICLGNSAVRAVYGDGAHGITNLRGSVFTATQGAFTGRKCFATYHPAACLRMYSWTPVLALDLKRGREEGLSKELSIPQRILKVGMDYAEVVNHLHNLNLGNRSGYDIEGWGHTGASCLAIATDPFYGFSVPLSGGNEGTHWLPEQEKELWKLLGTVIPSLKCVMHNGQYDSFVMAWQHKMWMRSWCDDTMHMGFEMYSELPKSLQFMTSVYTKEPYYKDEKKAENLTDFWKYNVKDACVTLEIAQFLESKMTPEQKRHYRFNFDLTRPVAYMMLRGVRIDHSRKAERLEQVAKEMVPLQEEIKKLTGEDLNVKSPLQMKKLLYGKLGLPEQKTRGKLAKVTTNYEAMLNLRESTKHSVLTSIIRLVQLRTRKSQLEALTTDADGRTRCSFNIVGTVTCRFSSSGAPSGSGTNLQTMPDDNPSSEVPFLRTGMRELFIPDEGYDFWQCDLAGADGWTVAARCKQLGYPTMWEDYCFGLKPAKILVLMLEHGTKINTMSLAELKELSKTVKKDDWRYFCCKQVQHGTNYTMKARTVQARIFIESEGTIKLPLREAENYQKLYLSRYHGVPAWQNWVGQQVASNGFLVSASGHKRIFMGRRNDPETLGEACSNEPQENTSYVCNLALLRMWDDPDNRDANGRLIIEPSLQVHDALTGQYPTSHREWAHQKIKHYFNNQITIAGQDLVIPFEARFGSSWGNLTGEIK